LKSLVLEIVSHSEAKLKNLVFATDRKSRCFSHAQHGSHTILHLQHSLSSGEESSDAESVLFLTRQQELADMPYLRDRFSLAKLGEMMAYELLVIQDRRAVSDDLNRRIALCQKQPIWSESEPTPRPKSIGALTGRSRTACGATPTSQKT
jgi:hypothetical protein